MRRKFSHRAALALTCAIVSSALAPTATARQKQCIRPTPAIGMSTPRDTWEAQLAEVPGVTARRVFATLGNEEWAMQTARSEVAAGRLPIVSFKIPGNDWTGAAQGKYDAQLKQIVAQLATLPGRSVVAVHHEPFGDGTPEAYAAMQRHILPILSAPKNVDSAVILNGSWWTAGQRGLSDAVIATWLPADVIAAAEIVAADTYQGGRPANPGEDAGVKIERLAAWATRVGAKRLGIAEYNGLSAATLTKASDAILADPRFEFGLVFNSNANNREGVEWRLAGDRLEAFRATVAKAAAACGAGR